MDIIQPTSIFDLSQEIEEGGEDFLIRLSMPAMV